MTTSCVLWDCLDNSETKQTKRRINMQYSRVMRPSVCPTVHSSNTRVSRICQPPSPVTSVNTRVVDFLKTNICSGRRSRQVGVDGQHVYLGTSSLSNSVSQHITYSIATKYMPEISSRRCQNIFHVHAKREFTYMPTNSSPTCHQTYHVHAS